MGEDFSPEHPILVSVYVIKALEKKKSSLLKWKMAEIRISEDLIALIHWTLLTLWVKLPVGQSMRILLTPFLANFVLGSKGDKK